MTRGLLSMKRGKGAAAFAYAVLMASTAMASVSASPAAGQTTNAQPSFDIPSQPLGQALMIFGRQSGLQVTADSSLTRGKVSAPVNGKLSAAEALGRLLAGTGLTYRFVSGGVRLEQAPVIADSAIRLGTLRIEGVSGSAGTQRVGDNGRRAGWDGTVSSVYLTPGSVEVIGKEALDAYPGQSPADMLRSATGVISGEARTSGGLDVNIRGLQGQGRVPVTVDGAINGTTVYRGYQGTSNRNFVDPDFISHIAIEKGPSTANAIAGGIGGSVSMTTISVDDILPEGNNLALRVMGSLSNNSSSPRSNMTRNLLEPATSSGDSMAATRERDRPGFLSPTGGSGSFVIGSKGDTVDLLAGYSFRQTGNYHAGENGKYAPKGTGMPSEYCAAVLAGSPPADSLCARAIQFYDNYGSTPFVGGEEVYNTSNDTESVIVKATIRPAEHHVLELGYGGYWSTFGENYPGSLNGAQSQVYQNSVLSQTDLDRFTARYRWNPTTDLLDLKINGWLSKLRERAPSIGNADASRRYVDSWGVDLTNSSEVLTSVGLLSADYGVSFLREEAGPVGEWKGDSSIPPGREGTRKEYSLFTQTAFEPTPWLRLFGGGRYQRYKLRDEQSGTTHNTDILDRSEDAFGFSVGTTLMPIEGLQLFANYKRAARLPSLMEATTGFFMIANPELHKEEAQNWEFGANYSHTGLFSSEDTLGLKLIWFDNDIEGYIARRYITEYYAMQMYNIDKAHFRGLEGNISYQTGGFSMDAGATWYDRVQFCREAQDCIESSLASDYGTNYIPPRWSANLSLNQKFFDERLMLGARFTYIGKRAAEAEMPSSGYMPLIAAIDWHPYVLADVTGSFKINEALALNWSVDNLSDHYYNEAMSLGYVPAPGRTFRVGFTGTLGSEGGFWPGKWFSGIGNADPVDWTGFHIGADVGYGIGRTEGSVFDTAGNPADLINDSRYSESVQGMLGGLHAGFNYQLPNKIVVGIEAGLLAGDLGNWSGVGLSEDSAYTDLLVRQGKLESDTLYEWNRLISLRGKFGYSLGETLIYGTGGIGWLRETQTRNQYRSWASSGDKGISNNLEHYFSESARHNRQGVILGGGIERSIGKNWSLRADYQYAHFGSQEFAFEQARAGVARDYSFTEIVGYREVPGQVITFPDGSVIELPPYEAPIYEQRDVTGNSNITEGRVNRGDADLHVLSIGVSYRF